MHDAHFPSLEKLDTAILYIFELISSVAILLLAFGLIASMANVLTEGSVLSDNVTMQRVWAWTQCVAIDASVAGTILRTFQYYARREWVKTILSGLLSALLLFTAAIVSNIEALQQTLSVALGVAYAHVFIPVEVLIWIRSLCIVLLIVAHALRHVRPVQEQGSMARTVTHEQQPVKQSEQPTSFSHTTVQEEPVQALPSPQCEQVDEAVAPQQSESEAQVRERTSKQAQHANNAERVRQYLSEHPNASVREIARALSLSPSTAYKWVSQVKTEQVSAEQETPNTTVL
jgi:hypothetical protein